MNNVSTVNSSNTAALLASAGGDPTNTSLSPETLILYCSSRLESLDTNIKQYFADQQRRNAQMKDASKLISILQSGTWSAGQLGSDQIENNAGHQQNHANKANEILAIWRTTDSPEVKAACERAFHTVTGLNVNDFANKDVTAADIAQSAAAKQIQPIDQATWATQVEDLKNDQTSMSKSAEMNMIQLQSLVSQRQLAVQLTTQLLQTMHETSKQVVGNVR